MWVRHQVNEPYFDDDTMALPARADASRALDEDLGTGDLTSGLVDPGQRSEARVMAREAAVICGRLWVEATCSSWIRRPN